MASVPATRLRKGNLVKHNGDLCRVVEQQHVTPGNLRGFVRAKLRKVKDGSMFEHRFRSEDMVERAALDEREREVKAVWPEELRLAYAELATPQEM